ncbi:unnamed protein product [Closterium sp. Yama58-4]|nr:unnamed protein product [Closterium sp. Yama58-4]
MDGEDLRNGDGGGRMVAKHGGGDELNAGKERGLKSGEELESKEREVLEMSGDDGEEKEEKGEEDAVEEEEEVEEADEEEEGGEEEEGEENEEDIIESLIREIDAWKGEGSAQMEGQGGIDRREKGESAFRWRNEVGDEEEMLTQHHDSYQWQWPVARLGDSWRGMFMREARYDIVVSAELSGVFS